MLGAAVELALSGGWAVVSETATGGFLGPALSTTSGRDREFLQAMAGDTGRSSSADIGKRLGMRPNAVGNYRTRLMDVGLVEPAGYGFVDFAIPGLGEYITAYPSSD
jgi:hypothetical protein